MTYISMHEREELAGRVEALGQQVNELRLELVQRRLPFVAGALRGAEETLLVVFTMLKESESNDL